VAEPVAIFTLAGTVTKLGFELVNVTVMPGVAASPLRRTVPKTWVVEPPTTDAGERLKLEIAAG
jgi:hypothetical protein